MVIRRDMIDPVDPYEKEWNEFHDKIDDECAVNGIKLYEAKLIWEIGKVVFRELRYMGAKFTFDFSRSD